MNTFEIKVSDLLKDPGKVDSLEFEDIPTELLPNLSKKGISGKLILQSINDSTVWVTLENVTCTVHDKCDRCLEDFDRDVVCEEYKSKFEIPNDDFATDGDSDEEDEIFTINPKSENINIEDMIVQAIGLEEPFIKKCENCKDLDLGEDMDDDDMFSSGGNVVFS